jgi:hypothetical protein
MEKSFRSGFTGLAIMIFVFLFLASLAMILVGLLSRGDYLPEDRFLCCFLPAIIGVAVLGLWVFNIFNQLGQTITVTPRSFHYRKGSFEMQSTWDDLIYDAPDDRKRFLRSITFCNGRSTITIYNIYFPQFAVLARLMTAAKRKSNEAFGL